MALTIFFVPKAFAEYDCTVAYPGADSVSPFTYDACCYPAAEEPYQGVYCRPDNAVVRKIGSNPPVCSAYPDVLTLATSSRSLNRLGFNCFDGTINAQCRSGYCKNTSNSCVAISGVACPSNLYRLQICPGGCGACKEGYVYCVNNLPDNLPDETTNPTLACELIKDGSTWGPNGGRTCAELGRDILNPCTGECTSCPTGKTLSGRYEGVCVTFGERFIEIFSDGLTWLGGVRKTIPVELYAGGALNKMQAVYDYTPTTSITRQDDVYLKADIAGNLDWNNKDIPATVRKLIDNNYTTCNIGNPLGANADCPAGTFCGTNGLCYGTVAENSTCINNSVCQYGLYCDPTGHCVKNASFYSLFTGFTPISYTGNLNNGATKGYGAADGLCNSAFASSHVCTSQEIMYSYSKNAMSTATGMAWVNNGAPGYIKSLSNDCSGWTSNYTATYGSVINIDKPGLLANSFYSQPCVTAYKFACCK